MRYILRRNPHRAKEVTATREDKRRTVERLVEKQNCYLSEHPRARVSAAQRVVGEKIERLRTGAWLKVRPEGRSLRLEIDEAALKEVSRLDGCYVIKTDLPKEAAGRDLVHERYKDLARVEPRHRRGKSSHLEVRPVYVYVRTEQSTRGHVLMVMLAYMIVRALGRAWAGFDLSVEEGLESRQGGIRWK